MDKPLINSDALLRNQLATYQNETDPGKRAMAYANAFSFTEPPTRDMKSAYDYVVDGYIADNPGPPHMPTSAEKLTFPVGDTAVKRVSYVGIYYYDGATK